MLVTLAAALTTTTTSRLHLRFLTNLTPLQQVKLKATKQALLLTIGPGRKMKT